MTTTLTERADTDSVSPAQWLRDTTIAVRLSFTWFGVRKTLTNEQKNLAAESFGAEGEFLSARKKLLDTKHAAYKEVTAARGKMAAYWKSLTLPFPEPGIRLLRQHQMEAFSHQMIKQRGDLEEAVVRLDDHYAEMKNVARRRLGNLFNPHDYPTSLQGLFGADWDWPSVEPPDYLLHLSPAIYEQERNRVAARFDQAVQLAEEAFIGELAKLVEHLTERLSSSEGERKVFRDSAITNLTEFFDRFRQLNVRSNQEFDALVARAQQVIQGIQPQALRDNQSLRQHVATQFSQVQSVLDGMMVDRPRRRIIRNQEISA